LIGGEDSLPVPNHHDDVLADALLAGRKRDHMETPIEQGRIGDEVYLEVAEAVVNDELDEKLL
jgi:hypothetical protein